jgi:hypothetical protein
MSKQNAPVADAPVSLENIEKLYDFDFPRLEGRKKVEESILATPELVPLLEEAGKLSALTSRTVRRSSKWKVCANRLRITI